MRDFDWLKQDEDKFYVNFEITAWGKTHKFSAEYENDVNWSVILDDVTRQLEASYGFAFDLDKAESIGVYYPGKHDE
mgnify:CR=1 FL=1|jgi:hypothetical protein|tara:strand:+ start:63 stop:293 length:231 start_codon:yes stop_codon:yes gene_type:complete